MKRGVTATIIIAIAVAIGLATSFTILNMEESEIVSENSESLESTEELPESTGRHLTIELTESLSVSTNP